MRGDFAAIPSQGKRMPTYEYQCRDCKQASAHFFRSFSQVRAPVCPHCASTDLERLVSRVAVHRGGVSPEDPSFIDDFDESDPRALGRLARSMGEESGEELPGEYEDMVRELESGKIPDDDDFGGAGDANEPPL